MSGWPAVGHSKNLSPEQRVERARKAALARTTTDAHVRALVDKAPPLTQEQREALALLLARPLPSERGGDAA